MNDATNELPVPASDLEQSVKDSFAPVQTNSHRDFYLTKLQAEREELKQKYQLEKAKVDSWEERQELLSQHRSALAKNQYQMSLARALEGKTFSDIPITYGGDPLLSYKIRQSITLLEISEYSDKLVAAAKRHYQHFKNRGLHHEGHQLHELYLRFEQVLQAREKEGGVGDHDSWKGYKPGMNDAEIEFDEQEIDAEEWDEILALENTLEDTAEHAVADPLAADANEGREKPGSEKYPSNPQKDDDESAYSLEALTKAYRVDPGTAKETATQELDMALSEVAAEEPKYVPLSLVEGKGAKKKNLKGRVLGGLARAAFVVGGIAVVFSGYHALRNVNTAPKAEYHGTAIVEIASSPKAEVKESAAKRTVAFDQKAVIDVEKEALQQKNVAKAPLKKVQLKNAIQSADDFYAQIEAELEQEKKSRDAFYDELNKKHTDFQLEHLVEKGDTIFGLWKNYAVNGGPLAFKNYLRDVKKENPKLKNPDKIWPGQTLMLPSLD